MVTMADKGRIARPSLRSLNLAGNELHGTLQKNVAAGTEFEKEMAKVEETGGTGTGGRFGPYGSRGRGRKPVLRQEPRPERLSFDDVNHAQSRRRWRY